MRLAALLLMCWLTPALAAPADKAPSKVDVLPAIVIAASKSTPPMARYTRGQKVVWLLGTPGLLPKDADIDWSGVEARIAESDVVLGMKGLVLGGNVGVLRALTLWPSIRRVRFNANDARLEDVLPPEVLVQWEDANHRYLDGGNGTSRLRPMYAAFELYRAAFGDAGLAEHDLAGAIERIAKRHGVPMVDARARLAIADPKRAVRAFNVPLDADVGCLQDTLARLESFLPSAQARGDAWLSGDVATLRKPRTPQETLVPCWAVLTNQAIASGQGVADLEGMVNASWREQMETAVAAHATVFAMVGTRDLLDAAGLVATLEAAGFRQDPMPATTTSP